MILLFSPDFVSLESIDHKSAFTIKPTPTCIIDSTLREGMQAPGVRFTPEQSMEIAQLLAQSHVDAIECGHPAVSDEERARIRAVVSLDLPTPVLSHARACREDIAAVAECGVTWVGIFLGVNEMTRRTRVLAGCEEALFTKIRDSVRYAHSRGLRVRYTIEDSSRTDSESLLRAFKIALDEGADRICFADTVGLLEPLDVASRIRLLRSEFPSTEIEAHFHNDRGLAMANALAAIDSGATWISTSVNGLGERCGITDTVALMANLQQRGEYKISSPAALQGMSRRVAAFARTPIEPQRPIVGCHAFQHTAKLHVKAIERDPNAYSWTDPASLGAKISMTDSVLPQDKKSLVVPALRRSATELRFHSEGPGTRYVMLDERSIPACRQYCIVRHIPLNVNYGPGHVLSHRHSVDSLFLFIGSDEELSGLEVEVQLEDIRILVFSPASVFIPAGMNHSYKVLGGSGYFVNHVLFGKYNESLLDQLEEESIYYANKS